MIDNSDPFPLITIATVTYNAGHTLERTLHSVAAQTYPHIEHLFIDGCSQDNTMELIHLYVERNSQQKVPHYIRMINEPDKGLYDAMNKAITQAKGDYIVFLNAGDCLHESETITKIIKSVPWEKYGRIHRPAILYGETDIVNEQGQFLRHRRLQAPEKLTWRSFLDGMLVCHQSFYVRTDLARQTDYRLRYRFSADYDWCIRLLKLATLRRLSIHNTHLILTNYLNEGLTTRNHHKSLMERLHIMARHYGWTKTLMQHAWFVLRAVIKK